MPIPPDGLTIRTATGVDAEGLARLRAHMDREDGVPGPDGFIEQFCRWFETNGDRFTVAVAEVDHGLVGTMWLQRVERVPRFGEVHAGALGYVTFAFVERDYRNRNIGQAMLDFLRSVAVADGFMSLIVWPSERSEQFYRRSGFQPPELFLEQVLDDARSSEASTTAAGPPEEPGSGHNS